MKNIDVYELLGVPISDFNTTPFVTSWCIPTYLLGGIRVFVSIYSFTAIFFSFKWFADHTVIFHLEDIDTHKITFPIGAEGIRQSFSYFTYETFWGLAFYLFFAGMHTFVYAKRGYTWLDNWPRWLQAAHTVFYSTITTFPLLVTTVYWGSMWTRTWWSDEFSQWNMITMHALNSVFAGFETIFTNTKPPPITHLPILMLFMSLYLGIAYITRKTEGIYIYLWLDPKNGIVKLLLHVGGYGALCMAYFFFVRTVMTLRCRWTQKNQNWQRTQRRNSPIPLSLPTSYSSVSSLHKSKSLELPSTWQFASRSGESTLRAFELLAQERESTQRATELHAVSPLYNPDIRKPRPTLSRSASRENKPQLRTNFSPSTHHLLTPSTTPNTPRLVISPTNHERSHHLLTPPTSREPSPRTPHDFKSQSPYAFDSHPGVRPPSRNKSNRRENAPRLPIPIRPSTSVKSRSSPHEDYERPDWQRPRTPADEHPAWTPRIPNDERQSHHGWRPSPQTQQTQQTQQQREGAWPLPMPSDPNHLNSPIISSSRNELHGLGLGLHRRNPSKPSGEV